MKCVVCKYLLDNYHVIHNTVRDDISQKAKIIKCNNCLHIQLFGYRENLKQHYDKDLQSYDINGKLRDLNIETIISKEKKEITRRLDKINYNFDNKNLLDVGSGYGSFIKIIADKYPTCQITALEPSKLRSEQGIAINNINNINIINKYLNTNFVLENMGKYDIITLWHVLEHIDEINIDELLQNLLKLKKDNGIIIIEVPNGNDELFKIDKYKNINYMIHHISYFTEETLNKLLIRNNILEYKIEFVQRYGFKNYLNWIYGLGYDLKDDMFIPSNNELENLWLEGKIKNKNTDAILIKIN
jgi:2-polyprenyl-3-methyl-5-hydroxy-6-metoxy-1,4-benzoquinol methylase